jgi:hypothetical protein
MTTSPNIRRFTAKNRCPICGGYDNQGRGNGLRCYGYYGSDGSYAHCTREEHAGGLPNESGDTYAHRLSGHCNCGKQHGPDNYDSKPILDIKEIRSKKDKEYIVQKEKQEKNNNSLPGNKGWNYYTAENTYAYTVIRYINQQGNKAYTQQHYKNGRWNQGRGEYGPMLYRLPELLLLPIGSTIYIPEGEKCVDLLVEAGFNATCNVGGAGKWLEEYNPYFNGLNVIVLPDNDGPPKYTGQNHAKEIVNSLPG